MAEGRFPTKDADFNDYVNNVVPYLVAEAARLGISAANITKLTTNHITWTTLYPDSQNPNKATATITSDKNDLRGSLEDTLREIYADIPNSVLTSDDRSTLNLPERDTVPTPRGAITDIPFAGVAPIGGGIIKNRVRKTVDASRASRHELSDGVEVKYRIGGTQPTTAAECENSLVSKKAIFNIDADQANATKRIYLFYRWVNLSNQANNSPWTSLVQTVVV